MNIPDNIRIIISLICITLGIYKIICTYKSEKTTNVKYDMYPLYWTNR